MKNTLRSIPLIRFCIPFILGIISYDHFQLPYIYPTLGLGLGLSILLHMFQKRNPFGFGIMFYLNLFLLGQSVCHYHAVPYLSDSSDKVIPKQVEGWIGTIRSVPKIKNHIEFEVQLDAIKINGQYQISDAKILSRVELDKTSLELGYGEKILSNARIQDIPTATNPNSFDYKTFLYRKGIRYQTFIKEAEYRVLSYPAETSIWEWSHQLQGKGLDILRKHLDSPNEYAVGAALILGSKSEMGEAVKNAYGDTGATHVLAVSGLHVGILMMIVNFLFGLLGRRNGNVFLWIRLMISLGVLWSFALVTGASPSVLRATTMFSFVMVGTIMNKGGNIYNTLAASAIFLLFIQPSMLFQPGFQLSYLAVIGIVFFQPIIYKKWYVENKFGDYIWQLISVSLAAQLTTLPISLFYFHQFPSYFLISGIIVIPAAGIIMNCGLALLVLEQIPFLAFLGEWIGHLLYGVIWLMNSFIFMLSHLPFSKIEHINISIFEMLMLYASIGCLMLGIYRLNPKLYLGALTLAMVFSSSYCVRNIQLYHQSKTVIYDAKGLALDSWFNGKVYHHSPLNEKELFYASNGQRNRDKYHHYEKDTIFKHEAFIQSGPLKLMIINSEHPQISSTHKMNIDGIILGKGAFINFEALMEDYNFDFIVADGSNSSYKVKKWKQYIPPSMGHIPFYHTKNGAIIIKHQQNETGYPSHVICQSTQNQN